MHRWFVEQSFYSRSPQSHSKNDLRQSCIDRRPSDSVQDGRPSSSRERTSVGGDSAVSHLQRMGFERSKVGRFLMPYFRLNIGRSFRSYLDLVCLVVVASPTAGFWRCDTGLGKRVENPTIWPESAAVRHGPQIVIATVPWLRAAFGGYVTVCRDIRSDCTGRGQEIGWTRILLRTTNHTDPLLTQWLR